MSEKDLQVFEIDDVQEMFASMYPEASFVTDFARFCLPDIDSAKALLAKYWDSTDLDYGYLAKDWPLCADFAPQCAAHFHMGAYREKWPMRPAFGRVTYMMNSGEEHEINFLLTDTLQFKFIEGQTSTWLDKPVDFKEFVQFRI